MKAILKYDRVPDLKELEEICDNVTAIPTRMVYVAPTDPKTLIIEIERMMGTIDKLTATLTELEEWIKLNCNDPKKICIIV